MSAANVSKVLRRCESCDKPKPLSEYPDRSHFRCNACPLGDGRPYSPVQEAPGSSRMTPATEARYASAPRPYTPRSASPTVVTRRSPYSAPQTHTAPGVAQRAVLDAYAKPQPTPASTAATAVPRQAGGASPVVEVTADGVTRYRYPIGSSPSPVTGPSSANGYVSGTQSRGPATAASPERERLNRPPSATQGAASPQALAPAAPPTAIVITTDSPGSPKRWEIAKQMDEEMRKSTDEIGDFIGGGLDDEDDSDTEAESPIGDAERQLSVTFETPPKERRGSAMRARAASLADSESARRTLSFRSETQQQQWVSLGYFDMLWILVAFLMVGLIILHSESGQQAVKEVQAQLPKLTMPAPPPAPPAPAPPTGPAAAEEAVLDPAVAQERFLSALAGPAVVLGLATLSGAVAIGFKYWVPSVQDLAVLLTTCAMLTVCLLASPLARAAIVQMDDAIGYLLPFLGLGAFLVVCAFGGWTPTGLDLAMLTATVAALAIILLSSPDAQSAIAPLVRETLEAAGVGPSVVPAAAPEKPKPKPKAEAKPKAEEPPKPETEAAAPEQPGSFAAAAAGPIIVLGLLTVVGVIAIGLGYWVPDMVDLAVLVATLGMLLVIALASPPARLALLEFWQFLGYLMPLVAMGIFLLLCTFAGWVPTALDIFWIVISVLMFGLILLSSPPARAALLQGEPPAPAVVSAAERVAPAGAAKATPAAGATKKKKSATGDKPKKKKKKVAKKTV